MSASAGGEISMVIRLYEKICQQKRTEVMIVTWDAPPPSNAGKQWLRGTPIFRHVMSAWWVTIASLEVFRMPTYRFLNIDL